MAVRQTYNPNINIGAQSGWCLQYVDDAINSLTRSPSAQAAYLNELNAGRINTGWYLGGRIFGIFERSVYRIWTRVLNEEA